MSDPKIRIHVMPGYNSNNDATMEISRRTYEDRSMNFDVEILANFTLRYLPDTNEVALIKGDEILYSEEVS